MELTVGKTDAICTSIQKKQKSEKAKKDNENIFTEQTKYELTELDIKNDSKIQELIEARNCELKEIVGSKSKYDTAKWTIGGLGAFGAGVTAACMGIGEASGGKILGTVGLIGAAAGGLIYLLNNAQDKREKKQYGFDKKNDFCYIPTNKYDVAKWAIGGLGAFGASVTAVCMSIGEASGGKILGAVGLIGAAAGGLTHILNKAQGKKEEKINSKYHYLMQDRMFELSAEKQAKTPEDVQETASQTNSENNQQYITIRKSDLSKEQRRELGLDDEIDVLMDKDNIEAENKDNTIMKYAEKAWSFVKEHPIATTAVVGLGAAATIAITKGKRINLKEIYASIGQKRFHYNKSY